MVRLMNYDYFAKIYEEIMDEELYEKWAVFTQKHLQRNSSVLELGCGSGKLGISLQKTGYKMTGLDLSNQMLTLAKNNQIEQNIHFPLIERDMTDLSALNTYDSVISFNDSLCYLKNEHELSQVFKEVYEVLDENGVFLFDVHSTYQMKQFIEFSFHTELENSVFMWDSFEGKDKHSIEHDLSFFIRQDNELYERVNERHKERTYPIEVYKGLLNDAGFEVVSITGDFTENLEDTHRRWFFHAVKRS